MLRMMKKYHTSMQMEKISAILTISKEFEMLTWTVVVVVGMGSVLWSRPVLHHPRNIAIGRSVPDIQAFPCTPRQLLDLQR